MVRNCKSKVTCNRTCIFEGFKNFGIYCPAFYFLMFVDLCTIFADHQWSADHKLRNADIDDNHAPRIVAKFDSSQDILRKICLIVCVCQNYYFVFKCCKRFISIVCLVSKENLPAYIFKRLVCDQAGDDNKYPRFQKYVNALLPALVT